MLIYMESINNILLTLLSPFSEGEERSPPPHDDDDDAAAATGQRRQCAHHTPATGGESHRANQVDGDY